MGDVDLGFAEKPVNGMLANIYFPNKLGGKPAWLELDALPSLEEMLCIKCSKPKSFLCQIYAPFDDEHNFHRTIYVFICRTPTCQEPNDSGNLTVLRSQLPLLNDFYPKEPPPEEGTPLPEIPAKQKTCAACGCQAVSACNKCKQNYYCSTQHQRAHWKHHKAVCSVESSAEKMAKSNAILDEDVVFPEWEIVIEDDKAVAIKEKEDSEDIVSKRLSDYKMLVAEGKAGELMDVSESELDIYAASVDDEHFRNFKGIVNVEPDQIIRYKRNGEPVWIADVNNTIAAQLNVPICESCSGPRQFEFQIMPQMLNLLKDEYLDWGVLTIYTCAKSCKLPAGVGYKHEYIIKQDILPAQ